MCQPPEKREKKTKIDRLIDAVEANTEALKLMMEIIRVPRVVDLQDVEPSELMPGKVEVVRKKRDRKITPDTVTEIEEDAKEL
jgi:hypothetical protein